MLNKKIIDDYIPKAIDSLGKSKIVRDDKISKTFSGQISTFGSAVVMGSLLSAVAFFSENGGSTVERTQLMNVIYGVIEDKILEKNEEGDNDKKLLKYITDKLEKAKDEKEKIDIYRKLKNKILNAAVAVKLAMNIYEFEEKKGE